MLWVPISLSEALLLIGTPQPLYNTIVGVQSINNRVISKQKCIDYIEK